MRKKLAILLCFTTLFTAISLAQSAPDSLSVNKKRLYLVSGANAAFWTGSYIALNKAWYEDYERTSFHFFDDLPEWNQADKAGHVWTTYQLGRAAAECWKWAGIKKNTAALLGAGSAILYQGIIELQDAYSADWGFSWSDMGANILGAGLFAAQEIGWNEQRIQVKFSYRPVTYPVELTGRSQQLFGKSYMERVLKDYNGQTYWLSANLSSFFKESNLPSWLNISVGYGAGGLLGGRTNIWTDNEGISHDYSHISRVRKIYLSPDVDLTRIPVKSKVLKTAFFLLSAIKVPAPALEWSNGKMIVQGIKF